MKSSRRLRNGGIPGDGFRMKGMPGMRQRQQHIYVEEVSHGKSRIAARTSSLETLICAGDFVIRNPVFGSVISFGRSLTGFSGVSTIDSP